MVNITYPQYHEMVEKLQLHIPIYKYDFIISLTNGGNILAGDLAQRYLLPVVYVDPNHIPISITPLINKYTPLIVDEIIDTSITIQKVYEDIGVHDCVVLFTKDPTLCTYAYKVIEIDHPWITFPWEIESLNNGS